jgi:hypothetical protein
MARILLKREFLLNQNKSVDLFVNPMNISKIRGLKNRNCDVLKLEFDLQKIRILEDESLGPDSIKSENSLMTMDDLPDIEHQLSSDPEE